MKKLLVPGGILIIVLIGAYFFKIYGWLSWKGNTDTPAEYISIVKADPMSYRYDTSALQKEFRKQLHSKIAFFYNSSYSYSTTKIVIDTVLYNPELTKMAILVITQNPSYKQLMPDKNYRWFYDATCYLGIKKQDTIDIKQIGPNFTNAYKLNEIKDDLREACFRTFVRGDTTLNIYRYNLNDKRFWNSEIWQHYFEEK